MSATVLINVSSKIRLVGLLCRRDVIITALCLYLKLRFEIIYYIHITLEPLVRF